MTILLVDDELQLRNYLRTLIDWEGYGYNFLEAENGAAAVDIMKQTAVNLLMLDITMPVMSGFEVLEWIKENHYDCVTAMLTGHDEISFAQKAVRLGCMDYILKSDITAESILTLANHMRQELSDEIQQQQRYAAMETAARRKEMIEIQNTINYWLNNTEESKLDMTYYFDKNLGFSDSCHRYVLLQILLHDYSAIVNRYTGSDIVQFSVVFDRVLRDMLEDFDFFYTECDTGTFLVFLRFGLKDSTPGILAKIHELTRKISLNLRTLCGIHGSLVFTLPYYSIASSAGQYLKLKKLHMFSFWNPPDEIMCIDDYVFDESLCGNELNIFRQNFSKELENRNMLQIEITYDCMVDKIIQRHYCVDPSTFKSACISCVTVFLLSQSSESVDFQSLFLIENHSLFKSALQKLILPFCISDKDQDKKLLVKKAILLIQQHYRNDIGLDWLASKLYVNASYLSRIFSAETGQSATSYINEHRVEQAKRLIRGKNLKLYEVAEQTGFSSSIVFSSVFKKITGETPSEYKNRNV